MGSRFVDSVKVSYEAKVGSITFDAVHAVHNSDLIANASIWHDRNDQRQGKRVSILVLTPKRLKGNTSSA